MLRPFFGVTNFRRIQHVLCSLVNAFFFNFPIIYRKSGYLVNVEH